MEILINNVVFMLFTTDEKKPYEQGENRTVTVQSVAAQLIINFLNVPRQGPSLKEYY